MANQEASLNISNNELLNSTLSLLERGEREIAVRDEYRDLIIILGDTAVDIPFVQWLTGDNTNTTSAEDGEGSEQFINDENGQIVDFTLKYQKVCPELFSEAKPSILYYGCFCDARNASVDIANTYFTNQVLSHAERIKVVFVISFSALEKGAGTETFMKFLRRVSHFFKDIEKYRKSFAMIAIGNSVLVGDTLTIEYAADFLLDLRKYITEQQRIPAISTEDEALYKYAVKFIDTVLQKDGEHYKKIGIIRQLEERSSKSSIAVLQEERNNMKKILCDELGFSEILDRDFRCNISKKFEPEINGLVEEINTSLWLSLQKISTNVYEHYQNQVDRLIAKLKYFITGEIIFHPSLIEEVPFKFKNEYNTISSLANAFQNSVSVRELVDKVKDVDSALDIVTPGIEMQYIERCVKYLDILQGLSKKELVMKPWGNITKDLKDYISESGKMIQNYINISAEKVKNRVQLNLRHIAKKLKKNYNENLKNDFSVVNQKFHDVFSKEWESVFKMAEDIKHLKTINSLVNKLQANSNIPGISASKSYIANISKEGRYYSFLQFISNEVLGNGSSAWGEEFEDVFNFLLESKKWYRFLLDLYLKFSEYNTQMERKIYINFLENSKDSDVFQERNITPINFDLFLRNIKNLNVAEYESISKITLTESQLKELNLLLDLTLKHDLAIECSDTNMFVKGEYVSLQEVSRILSTLNETSCIEFQYGGSDRKSINIFALNTLYIDRDIHLQGSKTQLVCISPRWEIIGNRVINLNGSNGSIHSWTKANDGFEPGKHGDHGKPGVPGDPGGIFFGIGEIFVNGSNLTITANGGDGGPGQDGGNGREGLSGIDVILPDYEKNYYSEQPQCCPQDFSKYWLQRFKTKNGFECVNTDSEPISYPYDQFLFTVYTAFLEYYYLIGIPGEKGGNGGYGGRGGIGGNPGYIEIVGIEKSSEINTYANYGKAGDAGAGGWGGNGGKDGEDALAYCSKEEIHRFFGLFGDNWRVRWVLDKRVDHNRQGLRGQNGLNGVNTNNIKDPEPAIFFYEPAKFINKYKMYLREHLDDHKRNYLIQFHEKIARNNAVRKVFFTEGLVEEFVDLEHQYHLLKKEVDFYPFYKSLIERLDEDSQCTKRCFNSRDYKVVHSYLYAAVLSKINGLKVNDETDLIIDIEKYFDTIEKEIYLLQDEGNSNGKFNTVDKMKKDYKYRIDKKIQEAKYFIDNTIDPEIKIISREINNKIDLLINETISLQKETQKEKNDFEKKKEELEETLKLKKVFDLLKGFGRIISNFNPFGMVISAAIELGTSVGEYFSLGDNVKPPDLSNAVAGVNAIENNIKMIKMEKTEHLNNVLTELLEKITQYPEELGCLSDKVAYMKNQLSHIRTHKLHYNEVRKLEQELEDTLKRREIDLKSLTTDKSPNATELMKHFGQAVEIGSVFVEFYEKNKEDDVKIAAIKEAIKYKGNELAMLREYEDKIYEIVREPMQNIKDKLQVFANEPNKRSQVALDVGKWNIQSTLKDIMTEMKRVSEEIQLKADFSRCLEKLEEAVTMLITIYDRIQHYQDEQILSNHLANVCLVSPRTLSIMDQNLVNVTNHLEWSIRSSLVLKHYQTALKAFKQWVFPFGSHYLVESIIPSNLQLDGNLQNLVFNAAKEIHVLKEKISLYKASARDMDEILIRGEFNSHCVSCEPFFVWKDEHYRTEISRLLSGETVALKADVQLSEPGKDAIKFQSIKLYLKSKNESIQSHLDETMKMFDVSATHIGNSYYRYHDEIHLITSPKRSIIYSFEENGRTGNPVRGNEVYRKIKDGDLMLSPYTMWIFRLNATRKSYFRELNKYKGGIDLELEGKGSYVINRFIYEEDDYAIESQLETSAESELSYRAIRSVDERRKPENIATSGTASRLSSPINSVCNFLKIYTIYLITISFNKVLNYSSRAFKTNDSINSFQKTSMNAVQRKLYNGKQESNNLKPSKDSIIKLIDTVDEHDFTSNSPEFKSNNILCKHKITKILHTTTKCMDFKKEVGPFSSSQQESIYYNKTIQVPDMNYSLLLADFVARSFTGVKYQSEMDESLMSPKQVIFKRCNESWVKNENDVIQYFRLFSEMSESIDSSWFGSLKQRVKFIFKSLGFPKKEETDEYIHGIRNLYV